MADTYESLSQTSGPVWLLGPVARAFRGAIGQALDLALYTAKLAVKARFVRDAPVDALSWIGAERSIERYPGDTDDTYRDRVAIAWDLWQQGGTAAGIVAALEACGFDTVGVYPVRGSAPPGGWTWPVADSTTNWSRFVVLIDVDNGTNPFAWESVDWGDRDFGTDWTWGSTATIGEVQLVRRIIRTWKAAHELCAGIWILLPGGSRLQWNGMS